MDISCAFATSSDTPAHVELAETLGYRRAWLYDSPALYPDVWMILTPVRRTDVADRSRAGCSRSQPAASDGQRGGHRRARRPGARIASRWPSDRVSPAGSRWVSDRMPWRQVAEYVRCLKTLLAGETAEWDGAKIRMMHPAGLRRRATDRGRRS